jgi:opacity protein-like surface antigen
MRVFLARRLRMFAGVLAILLPVSALPAQEFAAAGSQIEYLRQQYEAAEASEPNQIVLARCIATLDEDAPPQKSPEKKIKLKPKPADGPAIIPEAAAPPMDDECGCGECAGCASCASCGCSSCWPFYVALSGGSAHRETVHEVDDAQTFIEFDAGLAVNIALGYRWEMFRIEAEYTFMNNDVDVAGAAGLSSSAAGNVNLRAWMLNIYHDIQICDWLWKPYMGVGVGMYQSEINSLYPAFFDVAGAPMAGTGVNTTSDMTFAFQFRAGMSRPICDRVDFFTGYRFFHGDELTFSAPPFSVFAPTFHPDGAEMHCLELGVRIGF